jgi:hypothetical protein
VKYADEFVLLAKEETELQGMVDKLTEIGSCYGLEMNAEENSGNENLEGIIPSTDYGRSKAIGRCRIFKIFG